MLKYKELIEAAAQKKAPKSTAPEVDPNVAPIDPSEAAETAATTAYASVKKFNELSKAGKDKEADKMHTEIADKHEAAKNAHHAASIHHMKQAHTYEQQASITTDTKARQALMDQADKHREKFIDHADERDNHTLLEKHSRDDALGL